MQIERKTTTTVKIDNSEYLALGTVTDIIDEIWSEMATQDFVANIKERDVDICKDVLNNLFRDFVKAGEIYEINIIEKEY